MILSLFFFTRLNLGPSLYTDREQWQGHHLDDVEYSVIFLQRRLRSVAKSLYYLGDIPGRTRTGVRHYFDPKDNNNVINIADRWSHFTDYQLCYWYVKEMNARSQVYLNGAVPLIGSSLTHRVCVSLSDLLKPAGFQAMLHDLELPTDFDMAAYTRIVSTKWNVKQSRKLYMACPKRFIIEEQAIERLWVGIK